jgi:hypothetical protein
MILLGFANSPQAALGSGQFRWDLVVRSESEGTPGMSSARLRYRSVTEYSARL